MPIPLLCVGGARPNFMKLAPLVKALESAPDFLPRLVHTGQHYDDRMSGCFFRDLGIREPDYAMHVGSGSHAWQTAEIMKNFEPILVQQHPQGVIVVGDVNSTLACAVTAAKLQIPVVHVEAGLRSFDRAMPEEINRIVTDSVSSLLLPTEESGRSNLLAEGHPESTIRVVGNLMIDTLMVNLSRSKSAALPSEIDLSVPYGLVTLHRPGNVDSPGRLSEILGALGTIALDQPLYFPAHPRTRGVMSANGLEPGPGIHVVDPLGYLEFIRLMAGAAVVLTDSGGIQEETTALGIPCLTLRENTERPVTVDLGTNRLAGASRESILDAWRNHRHSPKSGRVPPLWDGKSAGRCVEALREFYARTRMRR